jgi:Fe-S oxidoreductase
MAKYDYGAYFGPIEPLADATRNADSRVWGNGTEKNKDAHDYVLYLGCNVLRTVALAETITAILTEMEVDFVALGGPSTCCGIIHKSHGDTDVSEAVTAQTFAKFDGYAPKAVLTYCPSCHAHMDNTLCRIRSDDRCALSACHRIYRRHSRPAEFP